ncbi:MAG TPA: sigma-70 family RNA polymerase sigma factor [Patescibacteria group bacterium]|jgi:RNA polymerase sigma-70 factor (ECF subfamily)|nr:sigma-70 family RNA polymerase sigma factor [Patescibacteria group bacterium]
MLKAGAAEKTREETAGGSDEDLVARIAAGDERAFRDFAERYTGLIFSVAWRMSRSRAAAEDIVQETLLRLWQKAGDYDVKRGASVKTWLCRIATNLCIDEKRKGGREYGGELPETADPSEGAQKTMETKETGEIVGRVMQELPERQRSALILFHYEGMSVKEIAEVLQTTPKGAERLLDRSRQALRRGLEVYKGVL